MSSPVTFLFTDIEGSTRLWEDYPEQMQAALERHDRLARRIVARHRGRVFKTLGDSFYAVFPDVRTAAEAALEGQRRLSRLEGVAGFPLRVRMAIHIGEAQERDGDYFGAPLNRLSRLLSLGSGGQVLVTRAAREALLLDPPRTATILSDLGVHRLRDMAQTEHVFEIRPQGFEGVGAPLRALASYPNNLPLQLSSFVGRDRELAELRHLMRGGRLLTLTGVGGSGKTRLALQLADEMLGPDGAYLVELAPLERAASVAQSVREALGLREAPDRSAADTVAEHLRARRTLLVIDNCEHMVEEAADAVVHLLRRCPMLKVLATSREPLGIPGEVTYKVPPMTVPMSDVPPPVEELAGFEAVRLFVERAASSTGGFALSRANADAVFDICRRLDGIPLAIELAAARVRFMPVDQIARRLDDQMKLSAPGRGLLPRQQTLRALVDWSYDLLTEAERHLLERLSVFVGGFTIEAAEAVSEERDAVFEVLTRLVDKSLVQYEEREEAESRYRLLETIRQYAAQRLAENGDPREVAARHLAHYAELASSAESDIRSSDPECLSRISREHDNIRAALARAADSVENRDRAMRLASALTVFWNNRGHLSEGRGHFAAVLALADGAPAALRAATLSGAAVLESSQGGCERAIALAEEANAIWEALGDLESLAGGHFVLGNIKIQLRDFDGAERSYEEGMRMRVALGDSAGLAVPLNNMGYIAYQKSDYGRAQRMIEESIRLFREAGNHQGLLSATHSLAMTLKDAGQLERALSVMRERLHLAATLQHHGPIALRIEGVAYILERLGESEIAAKLLGAAERIRGAISHPVPLLERSQHERHEAALRERLGPSYDAVKSDGAKLSEAEAVDLALRLVTVPASTIR